MPTDTYPGDAAYTQIIQQLRQALANDRLNFPWANRNGVSRQALCRLLIQRHFNARNNGMGQTNADWLGCDVTQAQLEAACLAALNQPSGFGANHSWSDWSGTHRGTWYAPNQQFQDEARWEAPRRIPTKVQGDNAANGQPRVYSGQRVNWPGRQEGNWGWNQSHPEVPYIWGWDPKENGNENGQVGAHLGIPFSIGACKYILWITPKTAYFEGINTSHQVTRTVNGKQVRGFPKASVELPNPQGNGGCGQWLVQR